MDLRGPSLGLVGPSIESDRTLPRSHRPALDLIGPSLAGAPPQGGRGDASPPPPFLRVRGIIPPFSGK